MFLWVANFRGLIVGFTRLPTLSRNFIVGSICLTKNRIWVFNRELSLFVSLSFLYLIFFSFLSCWLPPFSFMLASLLFSLIQRTPPFVCSSFHFLFSLVFSSLYFPSFSLLFFSFGLHQPNGPKSGKLLATSSFATCHSHIFLNFFHFPLFSSCDTWLNVSHLSQFAPTHGYHAMCPAHRVPCGIHMVLPCVTRYLMPRKM